jgi:biotin transport system substrate-specific component
MRNRSDEEKPMSKELAVPFSSPAPAESLALRCLRASGIALAGSLFVALCAHLSLPLFFTPVPITLQPFAVLVLALLLSPQLAAASLLIYLAEGALGLPVFAPGPASLTGIAHLLGPTGGYLLSYPVVAPLVSALYRRTRRGYAAAFAVAAAGSVLILTCGATWFAVFTHAPLRLVLAGSVLPFLPGDALKVAAAAAIAVGVARFRRNR